MSPSVRRHAFSRLVPLAAPVLAAWASLAAFVTPASSDERLRLDVRASRQAERFQSHEADSLGLSVSFATNYGVDIDFRVMDLPMKKATRPALHAYAHAQTSKRVFVASAGGPGSPERTLESPMLETGGGLGLAIPLGIVDGSEGVSFLIRYDGGVVIAEDTGENFIQTSMLNFDFQRTGGIFDGTVIGAGYGHDDLYGPTWAAKRWDAHLKLYTAVGPVLAPPAAPTTKPAAKGAAPSRGTAPLRVFVELSVNTDGRPGPDTLTGRAGVAFDAGALISGFSKAFGN